MGRITDGTGHNYEARVNSDNKLEVLSHSENYVAYMSRVKGKGFGITTGKQTIGTTEQPRLLFKNNNTDLYFSLTGLYVGWNGGNTSKNKVCWGWIYQYDEDPTANFTEVAFSNINTSSSNISNITAYIWDTVGDGITVAAGSLMTSVTFGNGFTYIPLEGTIILGPGKTIGFTLQGEEAGVLTTVVVGYLQE